MLWSKTLSGSSQGRCKTRPGKITTYFNFSYSRSLSNWNIGIGKRKWSRKYVTRGLGELPGHINIFRVKKTQKHSYLPGFNVVLFPMEGKFIRGGIVLLISRFLLSHIDKNTQINSWSSTSLGVWGRIRIRGGCHSKDAGGGEKDQGASEKVKLKMCLFQ